MSMRVSLLQTALLTLSKNWQGALQRMWNLQTSFGRNSQGFDLDLDYLKADRAQGHYEQGRKCINK